VTTLATIVFWLCALAIVYAQAGYPFVLRALVAGRRGRETLGGPRAPRPFGLAPGTPGGAAEDVPSVSLIIPAYDEEDVIAAKVENALRLDWPRERLQVIVADDGSTDATPERARAAGADLVLELPPGGKVTALNEAVSDADGEILAFSDANSEWAPNALEELIAPFADDRVGYVCGQVRFLAPDGDNLEGAYEDLPPSGSHALSFPFRLAKRGLRSLYAPSARAEEKMVPTIEGEFARKRRMMVGLWDIVVGEGMLVPRGYSPLFAFELFSHRLLRYATPFLHVLVFLANLVLLGSGWFYYLTLLLQLALLGVAALSNRLPDDSVVRICRYYVLTQASIVLGLWDRLRHGSGGRWQKAPGTR
jgi:cellulose synthase/poly-beta-1,6-N-acetylglucosamine synthase-like glycosyltransferase